MAIQINYPKGTRICCEKQYLNKPFITYHFAAFKDSFKQLISSPEHEVLMVSYCGQSVSVVCRPSCVVRRPSCVVRRAASTIALKAYSSNIPGPIDLILGRKHRGDL